MKKTLFIAFVSAVAGFCAALSLVKFPLGGAPRATSSADQSSSPNGDSPGKDALGPPATKAVPARPPRAQTHAAPISPWLFPGEAFEGTFVQLTKEHRTWSNSQWRNEFDNLRRIGINIVIVQWSQYDDTDFAVTDGRKSVIEEIATAADDRGMDLYAGLSLRKSWGQAEVFTKKYMAEELARNTHIADRLYPILAPHASFCGWYIPHEVSDLDYANDHQVMTREFFRKLTAHLNALDKLKLVLASGYTYPIQSELVHFVWFWTQFLKEAGIDVLLFQDGAGVSGDSKPQDNLAYVQAIVSLGEEFDDIAEVWLVAETFTQTHGRPMDDQPFAADPADIDRVRQQVEGMSKFKKRLIAYSYFDYMRPSTGDAAARLYEGYRRLMEETISRNAKATPVSPRPAPFGNR